MNLNLFGHADQWLMVDCGITFNEPLTPDASHKHDVVCADPSFIEARKHKLAGIIITHAHEDHIGALPALWQRFKLPVYTTPFTAEILRRKLSKMNKPVPATIIEVNTGDCIDIGKFNVTWLMTNHSIPEPHGLVIRTEAGNIFHTADWKIDKSPMTDKPFQVEQFKALAKENITAMVCDSTNALLEGHSASESECYDGLLYAVKNAPQKVVVTCFGTNIGRLITLARVAQKTGRYLALFGYSLKNTVAAAKRTRHWPEDCLIQDPKYIAYLPPEEIMVVATGSQGEPYAAMNKLAKQSHSDLELVAGDTVIFSSIVIPDNKEKVANLVAAFRAQNIHVIDNDNSERVIHASGHPNQEELRALYDWVKPEVAIPVHGEAEHIKANAKTARETGVRIQLIGENGDLYRLAPQVSLRRKAVATGRIPLDQ